MVRAVKLSAVVLFAAAVVLIGWAALRGGVGQADPPSKEIVGRVIVVYPDGSEEVVQETIIEPVEDEQGEDEQ